VPIATDAPQHTAPLSEGPTVRYVPNSASAGPIRLEALSDVLSLQAHTIKPSPIGLRQA